MQASPVAGHATSGHRVKRAPRLRLRMIALATIVVALVALAVHPVINGLTWTIGLVAIVALALLLEVAWSRIRPKPTAPPTFVVLEGGMK